MNKGRNKEMVISTPTLSRLGVDLTDEEVSWANATGERWWREDKAQGIPDRHGKQRGDAEGIAYNQGAVCAELALAKALSYKYGRPAEKFGQNDVGPYEAKSTLHLSGHLLLQLKCKAERIYFLVRGRSPLLYVDGWCTGAEGMKQEYYIDPWGYRRKCYVVPHVVLHDIFEINEPWDTEGKLGVWYPTDYRITGL